MEMSQEEAKYILCNVYESYRRLLHVPPTILKPNELKSVMTNTESYKSEISKSIIENALDIYDEIIAPILKKFPELKDELDAQNKDNFDSYPCSPDSFHIS